jgi:hypothetical protein
MGRVQGTRRRTHLWIGAVVGTTLLAGSIPHAAKAASPGAEHPAPAPAFSPTRAKDPSSENHRPRAAYVVIGLASAGAVLGTLFGIQAIHEKHSFDDGDKTTGRVEAIEKNALFSDMAFGAALTLAITGVVLWQTRPEDGAGASDPETASAQPGRQDARSGRTPRVRRELPVVTLAPLISSSGQGASALFRF